MAFVLLVTSEVRWHLVPSPARQSVPTPPPAEGGPAGVLSAAVSPSQHRAVALSHPDKARSGSAAAAWSLITENIGASSSGFTFECRQIPRSRKPRCHPLTSEGIRNVQREAGICAISSRIRFLHQTRIGDFRRRVSVAVRSMETQT